MAGTVGVGVGGKGEGEKVAPGVLGVRESVVCGVDVKSGAHAVSIMTIRRVGTWDHGRQCFRGLCIDAAFYFNIDPKGFSRLSFFWVSWVHSPSLMTVCARNP